MYLALHVEIFITLYKRKFYVMIIESKSYFVIRLQKVSLEILN